MKFLFNKLVEIKMKRLYFLTNNIDVAEEVSDKLHEKGIDDWHFHVMGKDKADIHRHHLHPSNPLQELDIVRSGERGAMFGAITGGILLLIFRYLTELGGNLPAWALLLGLLLFTFFGAWVGGLVGVSTENYKIRRFHDEIESGQYLLIIDVKRDQRLLVENAIEGIVDIWRAGEDSSITSPFERVIPHS